MQVNWFVRKRDSGAVSIEKLYNTLRGPLQAQGVTVRLFENPFGLKQALRTLRYFKSNRGRVNHITGDIHWAVFAFKRDTVILTVHDMAGLLYYTGLKRFAYKLMWGYLPLWYCRYITVISEKTRQELIQLVPSTARKIRVIHNCNTMPPARAGEVSRGLKFCVLVVGTRANKNLPRIIAAAAMAGGVHLLIVGKPELADEALLKNTRVSYEQFAGVTEPALVALYDRSQVLCFPSLYEGFGLPILEAQARNVAVITSAMAPMAEVAGEGGALLVDPYNVVDIANALGRLRDDVNLRARLISRGAENALRYRPGEVAARYAALYAEVLANNN